MEARYIASEQLNVFYLEKCPGIAFVSGSGLKVSLEVLANKKSPEGLILFDVSNASIEALRVAIENWRLVGRSVISASVSLAH